VPNLIVSAVSTFDNKGLKKGTKEISAFDKNVKKLGKTFAKTFAGYQVLAFAKKAVMAFAADEKASKALEVQLKNTGYAFAAPDVEYYIANLQKMYGVLDDNLRPAFQTLLTATGSITKSQDALQVALDTSAATGMSLEEVSSALSAGYRGQTKALRGLGVNLSKGALTAGHMAEALQEIGAAYSGQALARLDTYAGKMDQLKRISADATEIIGKGLLDAITKLSGDSSLKTFSDYVEHLATNIAKMVSGIGRLGSTLIPGNMVKVNGEYRLKSEMSGSNFKYSLGANAFTELAKIQEKKKIKEAISLRTQENALLKGKTAVDQLRDKFDLERIGLTAALNAATDDETKLRLKAQLAILDNNEALAKKYLAEMNGVKSVTDLATATKVAADSMLMTAAMLMTSLGVSPSQVGAGGAISSTGGASIGAGLFNVKGLETTSINQGMLGTSAGARELSISLGFTDTSNITDELTKAVVKAITISTKNGVSTVPAGQGF